MFLKKYKLNPSQKIWLLDLTWATDLDIAITFFLSDCESSSLHLVQTVNNYFAWDNSCLGMQFIQFMPELGTKSSFGNNAKFGWY